MNLRPVIAAIIGGYDLPLKGAHGVAHWARVLENGERLAPVTGADLDVVRLFAVFHDSRRVNEGSDPDHGARGAALASDLRADRFELDDVRFALLHRACAGHTHERTHPDITIQTCWDADRLDLGRIGITPRPNRLCTKLAKQQATIDWAHERAEAWVVPAFVREKWGVVLD